MPNGVNWPDGSTLPTILSRQLAYAGHPNPAGKDASLSPAASTRAVSAGTTNWRTGVQPGASSKVERSRVPIIESLANWPRHQARQSPSPSAAPSCCQLAYSAPGSEERKNCIVVPRSAVNWHSTRRMRNSIRIHLAPPSTRPDTAGPSDGEAVISTNRAKDRADAQRLVTTRLLDRLHDPLGHFSRLQRIYPRAW